MEEKNIAEILGQYLLDESKKNPAEFEKNNLKLKILPYSSDKSKNSTVCISGNRASLVSLAEEILEVAFGTFNHCHSDMGSWKFADYDAELCVSLEYSEESENNGR